MSRFLPVSPLLSRFVPVPGSQRTKDYSCLLARKIVDFFYVFAWGFGIKRWRGFLVNFQWSPWCFPRNKAQKILNHFGRKLGGKFGKKIGTKIRQIRGTFVLQLFWPNNEEKRGENGTFGTILETPPPPPPNNLWRLFLGDKIQRSK